MRDINENEEDLIRKGLALSKLSDLNFFHAMVEPMRKSYIELANNKGNVKLFHWEDILARGSTNDFRRGYRMN